jgi:DNA repair exonuclease SbcCD ATPase subunit
MIEYANIYKEQDALKNIKENEKEQYIQSAKALLLSYDDKMDMLRKDISKIDIEIRSYNDSIQLIQENYDNLINELNVKLAEIKEKLDKSNAEINEWDDMNVLFTKTLRYNLLETLIPHINKSIQFFINKLDQSYQIKYDQEFKAHIFVDSCDKEIPYTSLSTGQKKTLDLAIIFGILQNIISTIDVNILFLDELMSNMDTDTRNIMLALLNETMSKDKSVFIVNHSDMADDMFNHKIRVRLENRKMIYKVKKEDNEVLIKCSKYEQIF